MGYKGSLETQFESRYCPLCDNLEQFEAVLQPPLNRLTAMLKEIQVAKGEVIELFEPVKKRLKELEDQHQRCDVCKILIGEGHLETRGYKLNSKLYCAACKNALEAHLHPDPEVMT